jgi:hypothetical protein
MTEQEIAETDRLIEQTRKQIIREIDNQSFGLKLENATREQLINMLIHDYGVIEHLKDEADKMREIIRLGMKIGKIKK